MISIKAFSLWLPAVLIGFLWLPARSTAEVLVSNLDERFPSGGGTGEIGQSFSTPGVGGYYQGGVFRTGPGQFQLGTVTVEHAHWGEVPVPADFRLLLFKQPEFSLPRVDIDLVAELRNPVLDPTPTQFPGFSQRVGYSSLSPVVLEPDTTYCVGTYLPPGKAVALFMLVHTTGEKGLPGWSISDFGQLGISDPAGSVTWGGFGTLAHDILKFGVTGVAVPEPEVWSLAMAGILTMAAIRCLADRPRSASAKEV